MSVKLIAKVWEIKLPMNEQAVLLAMADHGDEYGNNVYPSTGRIAWKLGVSENTVRRIKQKLEARKILILMSEVPGHTRGYRIDIAAGEPKPEYKTRDSSNSEPTPIQDVGGTRPPPPHKSDATPSQPELHPLTKNAHPLTEPCYPKHETHETNKETRRRSAPQLLSQAQEAGVKKFVELWEANFMQETGMRSKKLTLQSLGKSALSIAEIIDSGMTPAEVFVIAKSAWRFALVNVKGVFWCRQSFSALDFCRKFDSIRLEVKTLSGEGESNRGRGNY